MLLSRAIAIAAILILIQLAVTAEDDKSSSLARPLGNALASLSVGPIHLGGLDRQFVGLWKNRDDAADGLESSQTTATIPWPFSPLSGPIGDAPIANFGVVEQGIIYRAAQPTEAGYQWLVSQGIKSIVSFRREKNDSSDYILSLGFENYLWLDVEDETAATDEQAERFLEFVTDSNHWPILIHCKVGLGRTGMMAALIRYAVDGWPMEEALREARLYRNGVDLVPVQLAWLKQWAENHPPASHRPMLQKKEELLTTGGASSSIRY